MPTRHFDADEQKQAWAWLHASGEPREPATKAAAGSAAEPAVEEISTTRPNALAFAVAGRLTADDYERTMTPRLKQVAGEHDKVDLLLRFDRFDGMSLGAMREDASLLPLVDQLRRIALVGGPDWMQGAVRVIGPLLPVDARSFDAGEEREAWAWIGAEPAGVAASA